ncbi:Tubulin polyglutamylase TTLL7 [Geodia barretti]|nr:Tubulin polyglutamylase TTLL7 [Geodia barretti]
MAARGAKTAGRRFGKISTDVIRINVAGTRYYVVANAAAELGMAASSDDGATDCNVYWIDGPVPLERYLELRSYQKINHFPGMGEISRKDALARNIQRMRKENRREYNFYPGTWVLPADHGVLSQHTARLRRRRQRKTFIVKPHHGSMGNGIYLTQSPDAILPSEKAIVQEYLDKPFLLDGFKCDLRIYVLVTSCKPLRILVFKDGLVRLSTERYSPPSDFNLEQMCMHLTNYSINRHSASFDTDERDDRGSKRTLSSFMVWLHKTGHNVVELWAKIHDIIVKTLILAYPHILHSCTVSRHGHLPNGKSQFFEILGFDVLLDHTLQPWVLEVNRSPSFGTDADLDLHIKTAVIRDALKLANISLSDKLTEEACQRQASRGDLNLTPATPTPDNTTSLLNKLMLQQRKQAGELQRRSD